ncbi:class I SAM-dependent methyltransferase [Azospirillum doebereinerae]
MEAYFNGKRVLEIGSLDINGSIRQFFSNCEYTGLDLGEGPGVDVICSGEDFSAKSRHFDVVVSCEAMEHNVRYRETFLNMLRVLKGNGLMIMSCATLGRHRHGMSDSMPDSSPFTSGGEKEFYYNLTQEEFTNIVNFDAWFSEWKFYANYQSHDLYFVGLGLEAGATERQALRALIAAFDSYYSKVNRGEAF